ncbi:ATP-binding protein [Cocleimonas sp. KMM 6892]|uniref:AAA family ATPase n=1 Tax=unclassified Cocleimonas TaxID=2639732 RepID=UPI002DBBD9F5|nr:MULTISPECIES: ATP-binding protein [unclassified Cocleimonas]MEB8432950.1 ATP-binding protein [Cocleimonas sp. KMM 6892]MEC4716069.1 ATP-binding protein [Cocleimonas sp. KMM 6895]MEC4745530.1 ATP-binding protein [Cocleimonas sp. KMM 6896]
MNKGTLTFFCGKMGAGKSTQSIAIAQQSNAILLSEDEWLGSLFPNKISTLENYIKYSNRLKPQIKKLVQSLLNSGTDVVMDFPANTVSQRNWFRRIFEEVDAQHRMIYIDLPDEDCLKHIEKRRLQQPERAQTDTEEMFHRVTQYFETPDSSEGFTVEVRQ